jgi:mannose/fructose/N-acetylgalactosamine-specific phosphotransferase system component IID
MNALSPVDLLNVSIRLVLVQSAWTTTSMQSEGFVYGISPALEKIVPDKSQRKRVLKHYQTPINTHPFLFGTLAGIILRMEEEGKSTKHILSYIRTTMGPLAALGDPFFDGALAPFASLLAAFVALWFGCLPALVTLLIVYNSVHIAVSLAGIFIGYHRGVGTMEQLGRWIDSGKTRLLRIAAGTVGGFFVGSVIWKYAPTLGPHTTAAAVGAGGLACVGGAILLNMKRSTWMVVVPAVLLAVLVLEVTV